MVIVLDIQIATQLKYDLRVEGLESVRIIKDRQTGLSRQFGFLHFFSVLDARAFLELNYPSVLLYNSSNAEMKSEDNHPSKVRISFCRERDDRERGPRPEEEWKCPICSFPNYARRMECRRCQASKNGECGDDLWRIPDLMRSDMAEYEDRTVNQYINTGDSDVSPDGTASQFLLFRGLEPSVTEELLAKGASKLFKTTGSSSPSRTQSGKKGNHKIASTSSDANFGAKEGSLKRVLLVRDRRTGGSWRYGFAEFSATEDSQAALAKFNAQEKFTISSKEVAVSYIHAGVFVPILDHNSHLERFTFSPLSNPSMKLAYWDEDAYVSELVMPEMKDRSGSKGTTKASSSHGRSMAEKEGLVKGAKEGESKTKKRKADSSNAANAKKAVPAHLNFWRNRHAELHGIAPENPKADPDAAGTTKSKNTATGGSPPAQSFADMNRKCCLLCSRQFKTEAEVNKHERLSQLHRDNSKNEDLKKKALAKLAKSEAAESPAYRDRARERRAAFKQPKRPAPDVAQKQTRTDPPPKEEETPAPSKGAALLGKMGWSAGEGLGAQGEGMAAPISTEMYVQGVGLGAQGGKVGDAAAEAVRNTKGGYEGFLEKTRDKAKERFDRLS
ncbi:MAG: hypothetical protein M1837_000806 [Sclerophora amabilis]|nr:MAG: hypothetical protein M1837_000806 [Sclerophora amabilis]